MLFTLVHIVYERKQTRTKTERMVIKEANRFEKKYMLIHPRFDVGAHRMWCGYVMMSIDRNNHSPPLRCPLNFSLAAFKYHKQMYAASRFADELNRKKKLRHIHNNIQSPGGIMHLTIASPSLIAGASTQCESQSARISSSENQRNSQFVDNKMCGVVATKRTQKKTNIQKKNRYK